MKEKQLMYIMFSFISFFLIGLRKNKKKSQFYIIINLNYLLKCQVRGNFIKLKKKREKKECMTKALELKKEVINSVRW